MKTHFTLAALALGTALIAAPAFADSMSPSNTMAPAASTNTMAPGGGGMMDSHKKPMTKKHKAPANTMGGTMAPATGGTMAPANTNSMSGSH